jgi:hypothetical protein
MYGSLLGGSLAGSTATLLLMGRGVGVVAGVIITGLST